jgi:hypothetical protein
MKRLALLMMSPALAYGGAPTPAIATAPAAPYWLTPTIDIRARYEFSDAENTNKSNAFTFRERLGLKTKEYSGFSAFLEGEFTQAVVDDYASAPAAGKTFPYEPNRLVIGDPESNEMNQGYVQYKGFDTVAKLGRQRIVYDNSAIVGNVIWRQNEQTYDAISLMNTSVTGLTLQYAYVDQVNRIFGSEGKGIFGDIGSELHFLNGSYTGVPGYTLGGYVYLMDFDKVASAWNNDTYGVSAKTKKFGLDLSAEFAIQLDAGAKGNDDSGYSHLIASKTIGTQVYTLGMEHLSAGFRTPLATLHAFNGFADVFIGPRADGSTGGLTDLYFSHAVPIVYGIKMTNTAHIYGDDEISGEKGIELNSVFAKKFDNNILGIIKLAQYNSQEDARYKDTQRASVELNYTF